MMLMFLAASATLSCAELPRQENACARAVQGLICWTKESDHIDDHDPALLLFWDEGESLADAKVDLAIERVNGCD